MCLSAWQCVSRKRGALNEVTFSSPFRLVFVPGLMCSGFMQPSKLSPEVFVAQLSPYASSHDRAVELFHVLKGGRVDYGREHSRRFGHDQFGRTFEAQLPHWDEDDPIVLLTHSHGANTARMLQYLLSIEHFAGYTTSASWIKAIICVGAPFNGCPVMHGVGMPRRESCPGGVTTDGIERGQEVGRLPSLVRIGQTLGYVVHWAFGDFAWMRSFYDFGLDHWSITRRCGGWWPLLQLLWGTHHILNTDDTAGYELTVHGASQLNALFRLHPCTYYFSVPCVWTTQEYGTAMPRPTPAFFLVPCGALTAAFSPKHTPSSFVQKWDVAEWVHNDLVVPLRSQLYPREGVGRDFVVRSHAELWPEHAKLEAGVWHSLPVAEVDHFTAVFSPQMFLHQVDAILRVLS